MAKTTAPALPSQMTVNTIDGPTALDVILKSADGNPVFSILSDGYAAGYTGDPIGMRKTYRTAGAMRRILEKENNVVSAYDGMGDLPYTYKINSKGEALDPCTNEIIEFNRKPRNSETIAKGRK